MTLHPIINSAPLLRQVDLSSVIETICPLYRRAADTVEGTGTSGIRGLGLVFFSEPIVFPDRQVTGTDAIFLRHLISIVNGIKDTPQGR